MLPDPVLLVLSWAVVVLGVATLIVLVAAALTKEARVLVRILDDFARFLVKRWRHFKAFVSGVDRVL